MDDDLAAIVAADEEARAHVQAAKDAAEARVDDARREIDRTRAETLAALRTQVAREVQAIDDQTARTVEDRVGARAVSIAARRQLADRALDAAADMFARIVIDGARPRERP